MTNIEKSIDVDVPLEHVYNQWTQFEQFPRFMEGVQDVRQLDARHLLWRTKLMGRVKEWQAEITEQVPDQRIAWTSRSGAQNAGAVTFHRLALGRTRVMLQLEYEPEGLVEKTADAIGTVSARVESDLGRFKQLIEGRGASTGGWRGRIARPPSA
jgi:uncharacterized membrane protein